MFDSFFDVSFTIIATKIIITTTVKQEVNLLLRADERLSRDVISTKETFSKQNCILKGHGNHAISRGVFRTLLDIHDGVSLLLAVNCFIRKARTQMLDRILCKALTKYGFDNAICYIM